MRSRVFWRTARTGRWGNTGERRASGPPPMGRPARCAYAREVTMSDELPILEIDVRRRRLDKARRLGPPHHRRRASSASSSETAQRRRRGYLSRSRSARASASAPMARRRLRPKLTPEAGRLSGLNCTPLQVARPTDSLGRAARLVTERTAAREATAPWPSEPPRYRSRSHGNSGSSTFRRGGLGLLVWLVAVAVGAFRVFEQPE